MLRPSLKSEKGTLGQAAYLRTIDLCAAPFVTKFEKGTLGQAAYLRTFGVFAAPFKEV